MKSAPLLFLLLAFVSVSCAQIPAGISSAALEFRYLLMLFVVLTYLFASGRIADFLSYSGSRMSKKEVLLAPFAYMALASIAIAAYFSSPYWVPPQDSLVTKIVYLFAIPIALATAVGALAIFSFFRDRLSIVQCLDLSIRIVFAPVFDGLHGYWTALTAVFIIGALSTISFFSSGGNLSLVTMDFLLLSIAAALYFIYRALTSPSNEERASGIITAFILVAPSLMRMYFKELVCSGLALIPFGLFSSCPLNQMGSQATLAVSVAATLLILVPIIPIAYAALVNILRFMVAVQMLAKKEPKR